MSNAIEWICVCVYRELMIRGFHQRILDSGEVINASEGLVLLASGQIDAYPVSQADGGDPERRLFPGMLIFDGVS